MAKYGNGGSLAPLVPVVTLPVGTTVDDPAAKAALARGFTAVSQIKGVRVASYADTADRHLVSPDGRTTYGLVFRPAPAGSGFTDNDIAGQSATTVADLRAALLRSAEDLAATRPAIATCIAWVPLPAESAMVKSTSTVSVTGCGVVLLSFRWLGR